MARVEVQVAHLINNQTVNRDEAVRELNALRAELAPVTQSVTRWKGALTAISIAAGTAGAVVAIVVKRIFGLES